MPQKPVVRNAVTEALLEMGPMTAVEIAAHLGWPRNRVETTISMARTNYPGKFFRVVKYELQVGRQGRETAVYAAGPGEDVPRPLFGKAHYRLVSQRYHQRNRALRAAQRRARNQKSSTSPWAALLPGKR